MPLSVLKDIRKIYAGLNADEIRGAAWQDVNVGLMASSEAAYSRMERFLAPAAMESRERDQALRAAHRVDGPTTRFDFILCEPGLPVPRNGYVFESSEVGSLQAAIVAEH